MKRFNITVNGKSYDVAVEEITDGSAPVQAAAPAPAAAPAAPASFSCQRNSTAVTGASGEITALS